MRALTSHPPRDFGPASRLPPSALMRSLIPTMPSPRPSPAGRERAPAGPLRSEENTSELQSRFDLVCRLLLEKKKQHDNASPTYLLNSACHTHPFLSS